MLTLKLGSFKDPRLDKSGQVLSMAWLPVKPHNIMAVGFYDGESWWTGSRVWWLISSHLHRLDMINVSALSRCGWTLGSDLQIYAFASARGGQVTHPAAVQMHPGTRPRCPSTGLLPRLQVDSHPQDWMFQKLENRERTDVISLVFTLQQREFGGFSQFKCG